MNSDVLIVGGGVIGLSIARELQKKGVSRITIVEKSACGEEASWAAAGMLGPQAEADEGGTFFDICCNSRDLFPTLANELLDETGMDIELDRTGTLYLAFSDEDEQILDDRFRWQKSADLPIEHLTATATLDAEPFASRDVRGSLLFSNDWQVENRRLLAALRRYAEICEIRIIENCSVESLIVHERRVIGAETDAGAITAEKTILATGAWTSIIKLGNSGMPIKVEPIRGQIIAFKPGERLFRHVIYSSRGYIVPRMDNRILAGSTTEHAGFDKSTTDDAAQELHAMAARIAPDIGRLKIGDHWSGLRPFAGDGLPVIGCINGIDHLFVATAHYRNGILLAPITARIVADNVIDSAAQVDIRPFSPDRFTFAANG